MAGIRPLLGTVEAFDEHRGLGTVRANDGAVFPFHATAVANGTRRVEVGSAVAFVVVPGHLGRLEATGLVEVGSLSVPGEGPSRPREARSSA